MIKSEIIIDNNRAVFCDYDGTLRTTRVVMPVVLLAQLASLAPVTSEFSDRQIHGDPVDLGSH